MGHEPDSIEFSTLGGRVATRASGMKRNRYGNIKEIVQEVRFVTSGGILLQHHFNSHQEPTLAFGRTSVGTELKDLVLGSEGNFGIITSAVVRVHPLPETEVHASVIFPHFRCGLEFMRDVARIPAALRPSSIRLVDSLQLQMSSHFKVDNYPLKDVIKVATKAYVKKS